MINGMAGERNVQSVVTRHLAYCQANEWAGYDPYDALNSKVFEALPFLHFKLPRLVLTQALKRSPINIRKLLLVPKTQNPKALGLFLAALVKLEGAGVVTEEGLTDGLIERLAALRSPGHDRWCWGYSFPWQMRTELVPRGAPNLVCTVFAADALLDAYAQNGAPRCLTMAAGAAEYILKELYWTENGSFGFSYPLPTLRGQVHNANFLAAALLCRVYALTGREEFLVPALKVARYSAGKQRPDGSWDYGEAPTQHWIDNFHTGFNLCALQTIGDALGSTEFDSCIRRGFEFYRGHFFREDGAVRYFHNRTYPIDIHCVAQSIITLLRFKHLDPSSVERAHSVFRWAIDHMWDDRGFFYYRVLRPCTIRTPYMRWSQAWMLLAESKLVREQNSPGDKQTVKQTAATMRDGAQDSSPQPPRTQLAPVGAQARRLH